MTKVLAYAAQSPSHRLAPFSFERKAPKADEIQLEILFCGVCHTDIHQSRNDWQATIYPCVPGHEIIGKVVNIGSAVKKFALGDIAGVGCMVDACLSCSSCAAGEEQYCERGFLSTYNGQIKNTQPPEHTFGGYASSIVVKESFALHIPKNLDPAAAAPLLCAGITTYSPLKHWQVKPKDKIGIIGIGGLGSMGAKFAHAMGCEVTLITRSKNKTEEAQRLGAKLLLSTDQQAMQAQAQSFDLLLNTIPDSHEANPYLQLLRKDGTMVVVGCLTMLQTPFVMAELIRKRKSVAGSLIGGIQETQEMLNFCAEHQIMADIEIINIAYINEAYERMKKSDVKYRFVIDMKTLKLI